MSCLRRGDGATQTKSLDDERGKNSFLLCVRRSDLHNKNRILERGRRIAYVLLTAKRWHNTNRVLLNNRFRPVRIHVHKLQFVVTVNTLTGSR